MGLRVKLSEVFSKDYIEGLKAGLDIARDVCRRNDAEIYFPDVEDLLCEKNIKGDKNGTKIQG